MGDTDKNYMITVGDQVVKISAADVVTGDGVIRFLDADGGTVAQIAASAPYYLISV